MVARLNRMVLLMVSIRDRPEGLSDQIAALTDWIPVELRKRAATRRDHALFRAARALPLAWNTHLWHQGDRACFFTEAHL